MKIGLFFGSFNPVHSGHLVIASYMAEFTDLEQVWLVVSPHNPLKLKQTLLQDYHRLTLVKTGIGSNRKLKASDIEFKLSKPSYTIHTLVHLGENFPSIHSLSYLDMIPLKHFTSGKTTNRFLKIINCMSIRAPKAMVAR
jgi:nicotinate-nucleotide adenylyltransferase